MVDELRFYKSGEGTGIALAKVIGTISAVGFRMRLFPLALLELSRRRGRNSCPSTFFQCLRASRGRALHDSDAPAFFFSFLITKIPLRYSTVTYISSTLKKKKKKSQTSFFFKILKYFNITYRFRHFAEGKERKRVST